jgi:branched-subunit amino acid aminotransferase/4-amino-4-deoxychorismate lyase
VCLIDEKPIGDGAVGPITRELMAMYRDAVYGGS